MLSEFPATPRRTIRTRALLAPNLGLLATFFNSLLSFVEPLAPSRH